MANQAHDYDEVTGANVLFWWVAFALICGLMFITVYSLFTLTDLEADALNPVDACRKLNRVAKYEFFMLVRIIPTHLPASPFPAAAAALRLGLCRAAATCNFAALSRSRSRTVAAVGFWARASGV